jgi:hypothetical protein
MEHNKSEEIDYTKLRLVPKDSIESKLFCILDDIDTATDMFKPEMEGFEKYVVKKIKEAQSLIVSDGYALYYREDK